MEGAYAEASMQGAQMHESDLAFSKKSFASTLVWWCVVILFWLAVIWVFQSIL